MGPVSPSAEQTDLPNLREISPSSGTPAQGLDKLVTPPRVSLQKNSSPSAFPSRLNQNQAPEDSVLADIGHVLSMIFVGKESSALRDHFALYNPPTDASVLRKGCEVLKAIGRAAALVVGSVLVGVSRAVAFGGSAFFGLLIGALFGSNPIGYLILSCFTKNPLQDAVELAKTIGSAAAAIPAFAGACCQKLAFQKKTVKEAITIKDLFNTNTTLSKVGAASVYVGFAVGFLGYIIGKYGLNMNMDKN